MGLLDSILGGTDANGAPSSLLGNKKLLLAVGVLGGFTTFSSFSLEVALMIERREYGQAGLYILLSVVLAVSALFVSLLTARRLFA